MNHSRNKLFILLFFLSLLHVSMLHSLRGSAFGVATIAVPESPVPLQHLSPFPEISAHAYAVGFLDEGILVARERKTQYPPASLAKLLVALVAYELLDLEDVVIITKEAKKTEPKISVFPADSKLYRNDAVRAMLLDSANDIARAIAQAAGSKAGIHSFDEQQGYFVKQVNTRALAIGMQDSRFVNPTGLDSAAGACNKTGDAMRKNCTEENTTTASDLLILARYLLVEARWVWEISRESKATVGTIEAYSYDIKNTNLLLSEFPAIIGGKTGTTDRAGETFVFAYPVGDNMVVIAALLQSKNKFDDGRKIIQWLEENF